MYPYHDDLLVELKELTSEQPIRWMVNISFDNLNWLFIHVLWRGYVTMWTLRNPFFIHRFKEIPDGRDDL